MPLFVKILLLIILSICGGALYRLGGAGQADRIAEFSWLPEWIREFPKKRDVGTNLLILVGALIMGIKAPLWAWAITFGLMWGSLSTYWDEVPFNNGKDNFYMHGFFCGLSFLPLAIWGNIAIIPLLIRSILLGIAIGGWSYMSDHVFNVIRSDIWSEWGRGIIMVLSNIFKIWK